MAGRVVHFEIPFDDADRATSFYQDLFDWQITPMPELDYTGVSTGPVGEDGMSSEVGYIGGGMARRDEYLAHPVVTISVDDIDATLGRVEGHCGSTVVAKQPVGDMGFAAYFRDSEGNLMGLWESARN